MGGAWSTTRGARDVIRALLARRWRAVPRFPRSADGPMPAAGTPTRSIDDNEDAALSSRTQSDTVAGGSAGFLEDGSWHDLGEFFKALLASLAPTISTRPTAA